MQAYLTPVAAPPRFLALQSFVVLAVYDMRDVLATKEHLLTNAAQLLEVVQADSVSALHQTHKIVR